MKRLKTISVFLGGSAVMMAGFAKVDRCFGQAVSYGTPINVETKFTAPASDEDGKPRGISGMACLGKMTDQTRECLVINDEETFAEIAVLKDRSQRPTGKVLSIVSRGETGKAIVGTARDGVCDGKGKFGELDGEGIAVAQEYAYIISSHSCSGSGKYKPSSYLISRFRFAGSAGFLSGASVVVERSWRGADMLIHSSAGFAYGKPKGSGTNIEGVAVVGEHLYAGLRTPMVKTAAVLIRASVNALFELGKEQLSAEQVETRPLSLGENAGIRDLAALNDGSLLILSGPTLEQSEVDYQIWRLPAPIWSSAPLPLAIVKTNAKAKDSGQVPKAEALTVIDQSDNRVVVLVSYDNIDEGAPTIHEVNLNP